MDAVYLLIVSDNATEDREGQKKRHTYPALTTSSTNLLLWPVVPIYSPEKNLILLYMLVTLIITIKQIICW